MINSSISRSSNEICKQYDNVNYVTESFDIIVPMQHSKLLLVVSIEKFH